MGRAARDGNFVAVSNRWSAAMRQPNDLSRSLVALDQNSTIIAVIEMSQSSWLVAGMLPGVERQPRKKLEISYQRPLFRRVGLAQPLVVEVDLLGILKVSVVCGVDRAGQVPLNV